MTEGTVKQAVISSIRFNNTLALVIIKRIVKPIHFNKKTAPTEVEAVLYYVND
jgi:hypothetical protein